MMIVLARVLAEYGPPPGDVLTSSLRSSAMPLSATAFLLTFLEEPISKMISSSHRILSFLRALKLDCGSTLIVMGMLDRSFELRIIKCSLSVGFCSLGMMRASVDSTNTSALKKEPAEVGLVSDLNDSLFGNCFHGLAGIITVVGHLFDYLGSI